MPFGLCNVPVLRLMQHVLVGLRGDKGLCNVFILVFSDNETEHVEHLCQAFGMLRQFGLHLHPDK